MSTPSTDSARDLYRAGRFAEALTALDAMLALAPDRAELWNNRGTILAALHRLDDAYICFDRALSLSPGFDGALANRANALFALSRYEEAARDLERILAAGLENAF